jgi:hypothetical protein
MKAGECPAPVHDERHPQSKLNRLAAFCHRDREPRRRRAKPQTYPCSERPRLSAAIRQRSHALDNKENFDMA